MSIIKNIFLYPISHPCAGELRATTACVMLAGLFLLGCYVDGYYCEVHGICE